MALSRLLEAAPALLEKDNDIELASFIYLDFQKAYDKVPHKSLRYRGWHNRLDRKVADLRKTAGYSRWGGFKLEISSEWVTKKSSTWTIIILNK